MKEISDKYKKLQKSWKRLEIIWSVIHYGLGITATVLAFLASSSKLIGEEIVPALAIASGLGAAILTFLSPASRRKAYTEACDLLRLTRLRFESQDEITKKDMNDAVEKAQEIIAKR